MVKNFFRYFQMIRQGTFLLKRTLPPATLQEIETSLAVAEGRTSAEIAFAVEETLPFVAVMRGENAVARARALFTEMRVWDTEANNGVLLYLLLADRNIEIVADRGIMKYYSADDLELICKEIELSIRSKGVPAGIKTGIEALATLLARDFPPGERNTDEVANKPLTRRLFPF